MSGEFLRRTDLAAARETFGAFAPGLAIEGRAREPGPPLAALPSTSDLATVGVTSFGEVVEAEVAALAVDATGAIRRAGLPAVMIYVFDELWHIGERVRRAVSRALAEDYGIADDVWAFHVEPGRSGWPPHRGVAHALLDQARPEVINAWVALSDAGVDRSCMHVVPLDVDRGYPGELGSTAYDPARAVAKPIAAGSALAWNANMLHWGGPCLDTARGPRTSCTFTLVRADAVERLGIPVLEGAEHLDLQRRLDIIASQIVTYGDGQPDVDSGVLSWARASSALRNAVRKDR